MESTGIEILPQLRRRTPYARVAREIRVTARGAVVLPDKVSGYEVWVGGEVRRIVTGVAVVRDAKTGEPDPTVVFLRIPTKAIRKNEPVQVKTTAVPALVSNQVAWQ